MVVIIIIEAKLSCEIGSKVITVLHQQHFHSHLSLHPRAHKPLLVIMLMTVALMLLLLLHYSSLYDSYLPLFLFLLLIVKLMAIGRRGRGKNKTTKKKKERNIITTSVTSSLFVYLHPSIHTLPALLSTVNILLVSSPSFDNGPSDCGQKKVVRDIGSEREMKWKHPIIVFFVVVSFICFVHT